MTKAATNLSDSDARRLGNSLHTFEAVGPRTAEAAALLRSDQAVSTTLLDAVLHELVSVEENEDLDAGDIAYCRHNLTRRVMSFLEWQQGQIAV